MSDDIAGVSLRAPRPSYEAVLPGVGLATLDRTRLGFTLKLTLDASFAATLSSGGGATEVTLPGPRPRSPAESSTGGAARALIVEHRLLSRPELLWSDRASPTADAEADKALAHLRAALMVTLSRPAQHGHVRCERCPEVITALVRPVRRTPYDYYGGFNHGPREDCAHIALYPRALTALARAHDELALELAGALEPDNRLAPTRFVLTTPVMRWVLADWLLSPEARERQRDPWDVYGRRHARRQPTITRRTRLSQEAWSEVPEANRLAYVFAAAAWQAEEQAPLFARRSESGERFAAWEPDEALAARELGVMVPEEFRAPVAPPKPPREPRKARADAPEPPSTSVEVRHAPSPAPAEPSNKLYTMKDLAALGHGPAEVKRMLKAGTLARESFGWYRFAQR